MIELVFYSDDGRPVLSLMNVDDAVAALPSSDACRLRVRLAPPTFVPGRYRLKLFLGIPFMQHVDEIDDALSFDILPPESPWRPYELSKRHGVMCRKAEWHCEAPLTSPLAMNERRPATPRGRIAIVEQLRGLAAFAVMWYHFTLGNPNFLDQGPLKSSGTYGWLGVEVFFVISGFIIPHAMYRARYQASEHLPRFLAKRFVRLEPPYLATVVLCVVLGYLSSWVPGFRGAPPDFPPTASRCTSAISSVSRTTSGSTRFSGA